MIHQHANYETLLFSLFLQMSIHLGVALDELLQDLRLPGIPHGLLIVGHFKVFLIMFSPTVPGWIDAFGA